MKTDSPYRKRKLIALWGMALLAIATGALDSVFPEQAESLSSPVSVCVSIVSAFLLFVWYFNDSEQRGFQRSRAWNFGIILVTAVVVLPWYLIKTRGKTGGAKSIGLAVSFIVFVLAPLYIAAWLTSSYLVAL
jgi:uncharacterized membrane-anchored protein